MRTQPQTIIQQLEADNSRLAKEKIIADAMNEGLDEFFEGVSMCLDKLYTFGVKQVPLKEPLEDQQGLTWTTFKELAERLYRRELTGHTAKRAIELCMDLATEEQWNGWYRRILIKDLRCGVSEKTINTVAKKQKKTQYAVPVFECQLSHDSANHESKLTGKKIVEHKLDGVRCLTVVDLEQKTVIQYTRNGKVLENFKHVTDYLQAHIDTFEQSVVLDGEIMSSSFQDLMKQVHRKENVEAGDAVLNLFDIVPLLEFKQGKSSLSQRTRSQMLKTFEKVFADSGFISIVPQREFNLDVFVEEIEFRDYMKEMVDAGYEGVMIKDPNAKYECKRTANWLKMKPFIEVSLEITSVEEGTGRNQGRMGAILCRGKDDQRDIVVSVGSGFTDSDRDIYWGSRDSLLGQVVEVRADAVTQNQDGSYSLRFPRFLRFRGFKVGEKI
jgi:DNA ligase-1